MTEVIYASESSNPIYNITIWDRDTGTSLWQYKNGNADVPHTLCLLDGAYIISADAQKPIINIWPLNSQQRVSNFRLTTPGKVKVLAVSPDSNYLVAGIDNVVYIWQLASGKLVAVASKHYLNVTCIKFVDTGTHLITGGQEGAIIVWDMSETMKDISKSNVINAHSLPITDIHVGRGPHCRFYTTSMDRQCKIFDFLSQSLLLTIICDAQLTACAVNLLETNLFLGTETGNIYEISLQNPPRTKEYYFSKKKDPILKEHTSKITSLSVSMDNETLLSGADNGQILLWNIPSKNFIRQITPIRTGISITNAYFGYNYGNIYAEKLSTKVILHSLEGGATDRNQENVVEIMDKNDEFLVDVDETCGSMFDGNYDDGLRETNQKLMSINKQLYKAAVQGVIDNHIKSVSNSKVLTPGKLIKRKRKQSK